MKVNTYTTIASTCSAKLVIKKSTFLSFAIPVDKEQDVEVLLRDFKKKYYDARHICYAYILSPDASVSKSSDNGEPSGTAGRPIMGVLLSNQLTNILIVVIRYFGGIKLGTSGLIAAYKGAAEEVLAISERKTVTVEHHYTFQFGFQDLNQVMKLLKTHAVKVLSNQVDTVCQISISLPVEKEDLLLPQLYKVSSLKFLDA